ncbi:MAG: hypothetical protein WB992_18325 [Bryobacteraceae bacterium]
MRALRFDRFGDLSVLQIKEVPVPIPGPGEVLVNFAGTIVTARMNSSDKKSGAPGEMSVLLEQEVMRSTSSFRKAAEYGIDLSLSSKRDGVAKRH